MDAADPLLTLVNYGVLGLVLLLIITGQLAVGREVKRAEERAELAESKLQEVSGKVIDDVVPALTRVTDATTRATDALMARPTNDRR